MLRPFGTSAISFIVFLNAPLWAWAQGSFRYLGGNLGQSAPIAISADGSTVIGWAFRWRNGVFTYIGSIYIPAGFSSGEVSGVSADGSVMVGTGRPTLGGGVEAFQWRNGIVTRLGDTQGGVPASAAYGVSADGSVVVGGAFHAPNSREAVRWENGVIIGLGDLPGGDFYSVARAVSADGKVIIGEGTSERGTEAFLWENGVMVGLGVPEEDAWSAACAVSADGRVVVGLSHPRDGSAHRIIRWKDGAMLVLGPVADNHCPGISADGSTIVGTGYTDYGAFIWDEQHGMRKLAHVMQYDFGLNASPGSSATGISADAQTIVGVTTELGGEGRGWIARLPNSEPPMDADEDGVPDSLDRCENTVPGTSVNGIGCPPIIPGDLDRDGDVDLHDFAIVQRCMRGSNQPADPACNIAP